MTVTFDPSVKEMPVALFLAPQGLPIALVVLALEIYLAIVHGKAFRSVLAVRA